MSRSSTARHCAVVLLTCLAATAAHTQPYPSKAIHMIVPRRPRKQD